MTAMKTDLEAGQVYAYALSLRDASCERYGSNSHAYLVLTGVLAALSWMRGKPAEAAERFYLGLDEIGAQLAKDGVVIPRKGGV